MNDAASLGVPRPRETNGAVTLHGPLVGLYVSVCQHLSGQCEPAEQRALDTRAAAPITGGTKASERMVYRRLLVHQIGQRISPAMRNAVHRGYGTRNETFEGRRHGKTDRIRVLLEVHCTPFARGMQHPSLVFISTGLACIAAHPRQHRIIRKKRAVPTHRRPIGEDKHGRPRWIHDGRTHMLGKCRRDRRQQRLRLWRGHRGQYRIENSKVCTGIIDEAPLQPFPQQM